MTCEVVVMNKLGVALAADSAVTLGDGPKTYQNAEKLFQLSASNPIGIMTYGSAEIMGVPWETVIKIYTRKHGDSTFEHLEEYSRAFFEFIQGSESLFPEPVQRQSFCDVVRSYWIETFARPLEERLKAQSQNSVKHALPLLNDLVKKDLKWWEDLSTIDQLGATYGERLVTEYSTILDELESEVFGPLHLTKQLGEMLRQIVTFLYTKDASDNAKDPFAEGFSGIVIAGMGESEPFPVLEHYKVDTIAAGRLRFMKDKAEDTRIDRGCPAWVVPFAQGETINMFYRGIYPSLERKLPEIIRESFDATISKKGKKPSAAEFDEFAKRFGKNLKRDIAKEYEQPLVATVGALSRHELAEMAEALVSLTALRVHMLADRSESVGGPVDVAVISKGEGFVWVKRKDLVLRPGNETTIRVP